MEKRVNSPSKIFFPSNHMTATTPCESDLLTEISRRSRERSNGHNNIDL